MYATRKPLLVLLCGTATLLVLTAYVYWPALAGPFILDDAPNLGPLHNAGGHFSWPALQLYLESGWSGPTGRPLSLISFYLNAQDWPTEPRPFKLTNLGLHLVNGLLILALGYRLARAVAERAEAHWIALAAAGLWLLHPLLVSTVMYVSQRMVELAVLFTLLGLLGYLFGRDLAHRRLALGYCVMAASVGTATVLATYSKEIGALLPVYIWVLEYTVLAAQPPRARFWKIARAVIVYLPCLLLVGRFAQQAHSIPSEYIPRPFDLPQRLLTEPRVLFDYLGTLFLPWTSEATLFHDDYLVSTGWLYPATTLPAVLGVLGLIGAGLSLHRRAPVLALAILWFFGGHVLESSFIALELYFEHRNYLPAFGPLFALAYYALHSRRRWMLPAWAALLVFMVTAGFQTRTHAWEWSSEGHLAKHWYDIKPNSVWAHQRLSNHWLKLRFPDRAYAVLEAGEARNPDKLDIEMLKMRMACKQGGITPADVAELHRNAATSPLGRTVPSSLEKLFAMVESGRCGVLNRNAYASVLRAMLGNPHFAQGVYQAKLFGLLAQNRYGAGDYAAAVDLAKRSIKVRPSLELATKLPYWHYHAGNIPAARSAILFARHLVLARKGRLDVRYDARLRSLELRIQKAEEGKGP